MFFKIKKHADSIGAIGAALCIVHCLLLPIILTIGLFSESWYAGSTWELLDWLFIGLALVAVLFSTRQLHSLYLRTAFWLAFALFSVSVLLHDHSAFFLYLSVGASLLLMLLHGVSYRRKHQHQTPPSYEVRKAG